MEDRIFAIVTAAVIALAVSQPVLDFSPYYLNLASNILIFGIAALAYNLLHGYTGLIPLGTAGFYMVGAYGGALALRYLGNDFGVGLLGALGVSAAFALIVGIIATRIRGVYFLITTFAFSMLPWILIRGPLRDITGGHTGIHIRILPPFFFDLHDPFLFLLFTSGTLIAVYIILRVIVSTPFGLSLRCIKENELKLTSLGYNTWWRKTLAVTISGTLAGFAGYLFLLKNLTISPILGSFFISAKIILVTLIGGLSSFVGPLVGTFVWFAIEEFLVAPGLLEIILGGALVVVVLRVPFGIIGEFLKSRRRH
jgi:branched-chain amino acid transport system permease protein